jgi:uncharacterized protein (DUF1800 family)
MAGGVALLLRRAGFGPTSAELAAAGAAGYPATVAALTSPAEPDVGAAAAPVPDIGPDPNPAPNQRAAGDEVRRRQLRTLTRWWLDRMTVADRQATEKLLFFWHGHWATSVKKVIRPQLMLIQHRTLRQAPDFAAMVHAMVADPALIHWLDGQLNTTAAPNENLARELMELFTLGIGNYTEQDVREAARALTGWRIDYAAGTAHVADRFYDATTKTILGVTAHFTAATLVDLLLRQPDCPRFVATRLWYRYGSATAPLPDATREAMVAAFPAPLAMLRALFNDAAFRASEGTLVKQPVEWLVGAMRQLKLRPATIPEDAFGQVLTGLDGLGQVPFAPPSVGGWPGGGAWLTSAAAQARLRVAARLADLAGIRRLTTDELAHLLCVDQWTDRTYAVLRSVRDANRLLTLGLASPEYLVT